MSDWSISIDIGGTFTDIVALDYSAGKLYSSKVLTTHGDPAQAVTNGVIELIQKWGISPSKIKRVVHATTLFTNALIERRATGIGMLVNVGFKDIIEIGNERKFDLYDLTIERAPVLVPRNLRAEIRGRVDFKGNELEPLDEEDVRSAVSDLADQGVSSIAVCLLHSYAFSGHERTVAEWIKRDFPQMEVTLSSNVAPVIREFERMSTTLANAYIKPMASRYLTALEERLENLGIECGVLMMLSNGGLSHISQARRNPIDLLESGPAAGSIAAAHYGMQDGFPNLLAFDMGGTTAKLSLIENGHPSISFTFEVARRKRFSEGSGLPIRITTVDLIEIGAGGGSIAHLDQLGLLKVGPESAGSEPGPACYGLGGVKPTVTDANLILGYLNPEYFAGGSLSIYPSRAVEALSQMGQSLDRSVIDVAWGIHDVVAENMAGAARVHVAERGRDPRDFVLVCTGGGGPLHAYYVAQKIGVSKIVCPPSAGVASAFGLLMASARSDLSRTLNFKFSTTDLSPLENAYRELEAEARSTLETLSYAFGPISIKRQADGRFVGQGFNLSVELPEGPYSVDTNQSEDNIRIKLVQAFESAYKEKFGRTPPDVQVEFVNVRISGDAPPHTQFVPELMRLGHDAEPKGFREVYFKELNAYIETPIFERSELSTGFSAMGPLLIEDVSSTLVVGPKGRVEQLASGNLVITIGDVES